MGDQATVELQAELQFKVRGDLLAMKAPIFNEDFIGARAGHDHTRYIDPADVTFERHGIAGDGLQLLDFLYASTKSFFSRIGPQLGVTTTTWSIPISCT